jgi:hypothetical protein
MLQKESKIQSKRRATRVRIPWVKGDTSYKWNDVCGYAIEHFGLPGERYYTHATEDYMDFYFYDERDAIHFNLSCL